MLVNTELIFVNQAERPVNIKAWGNAPGSIERRFVRLKA
jgi:hypothetical protein